jgi:hypothetical protein
MRYLLLLFFLGYYSSITFFPHTHIVEGKTIVHSHPYNPFSGDNPSNHHHSKNEFVLIHILSHFLIFASLAAFTFLVLRAVLQKAIIQKKDQGFSDFPFLCSNGFRAPPLFIYN